MRKLSASNLVYSVNQLDKSIVYNYINPRNRSVIKIVDVQLPEGPIKIKRWNPSNGESEKEQNDESISTELIWRVANSFMPNCPINIDRILGASYNTRSVFEALLAHTPEFYYCYPGRIQNIGGYSTIQHGHKHLLWNPDQPHRQGGLFEITTNMVISEIPSVDVYYDSLVLPDQIEYENINIDVQRRHAQIQIALYFIGKQLNFKTWIAQNDRGIEYQGRRIGEYDGVIQSLNDEKLMSSHQEAINAARLIDCIWFKNGRLMPAVMEIEHSTGVTSGLTRMQNFKNNFPPFPTRYVIVAPDEARDKVIQEANRSQFKDLNTKYFTYSAVEELYALCQRRKLKGVTEDFLDCFMEPVMN